MAIEDKSLNLGHLLLTLLAAFGMTIASITWLHAPWWAALPIYSLSGASTLLLLSVFSCFSIGKHVHTQIDG